MTEPSTPTEQITAAGMAAIHRDGALSTGSAEVILAWYALRPPYRDHTPPGLARYDGLVAEMRTARSQRDFARLEAACELLLDRAAGDPAELGRFRQAVELLRWKLAAAPSP